MSNIYKAKGKTLEEQYYDAGKQFRARLVIDQTEVSELRLMLAQKVLARIKQISILSKFYECLRGWSRGLGISEELAMYLLADNLSGCQTAIVRYGSGVALLHTEEDFDDVVARLKKPHTFEFDDNGRRLVALAYHDLIPGAGLFGWQSEMMVAVDSIWLREDGISEINNPMLVNIVAWYIWQMDPARASAEEVVKEVKKMGTLIDGYAINVVRKVGSRVEGYKLTCARDDWEIEKLWEQPGDNLRQVNIIEPRYARKKKKVAQWRHSPLKMYVDYRGFVKRLRDMKAHIQANKAWLRLTLKKEQILAVHHEIHKQVFVDNSENYLNEWMGALCVGILDSNCGISVSTKLNDLRPLITVEYVDRG